MIKRITSNGTYWVIASFLLTTTAFLTQTIKADSEPSPYYALSLLLLLVCTLTTVILDAAMLKVRKLMYISSIQILLTFALFLLLFFDINIIPISMSISFLHCLYRIFNYRIIDNLQLELKYEDILKLLNLTNEFIAVKGNFKNYITYIRGKDISFDGEYSLFFRNKKVRFDVIRQLQIEFSKPFISFDDDELRVAEMYSIQ